MEKSLTVSEIISVVLKQMAEKPYSQGYIYGHKLKYNLLLSFCADVSVAYYSLDIGRQFLDYIFESRPWLRVPQKAEFKKVIARLDSELTGARCKAVHGRLKPYESSCFNEVVHEYERYLTKTDIRYYDVRRATQSVARFLKDVENYGCVSLKNLDSKSLYAVLTGGTIKEYRFSRTIKPFLKYAFTYGLIDNNLALIIPPRKVSYPAPTVYTPIEIEQMLAGIERSTEIGKRNYAMTIIAARLGLRASEIASLKFSCINHSKKMLRIIQSKSKSVLELPLLDDVCEAIYDYINNGRHCSQIEYIFLNKEGFAEEAVSSSTVSKIVRDAIKNAHIDTESRKKGPHSLRSSLATALLTEGNDYKTIQSVLGHYTVITAKYYAKADIEQLRESALSVPVPTGKFEEFLR